MADMNVLHLIDSGGLYGAEKMLLTLVEEQIKQGLKPVILSVGELGINDKPVESEARKLGLRVVPWRMKSGVNLLQALAILKWAERERIDILHSHGYKFNILMGVLPRAIRKLPLVSTLHGYVNAPYWSKMWLYEVVDQFLLQRVDRVCFVSEHMKKLSVLSRLEPSKVHVVENGLPSESTAPTHLPDLLSGSKDTFRILTVGRLSPEKNMASLIRVLASKELADKEIALFIVGEGRLLTELEQQVEHLKLGHKVFFMGYRKDVPTLMRQANLLAMPSLTEGLPLTVLEAMRCALPVLASAVGGIPQVLDQGEAGLLVPPRSDAALVKQLKRVVDGEIDLDRLAKRAQRRFESFYTAEVMAKKYTAIYSSLVSRHTLSEGSRKVEY